MKKLEEVYNIIFHTEIIKGSRLLFYFLFSASYISHIFLRKLPWLGKAIKYLFSPFPENKFIIKNKIGIFVVKPFNDSITISSEYFEGRLIPWLEISKNKETFLDLGANIGRYTILAHAKGYQKSISVEANPYTYALLKENINLNNIGNSAILKQLAVGDAERDVEFETNSNHLGGGRIVGIDSNNPGWDMKNVVHMNTGDHIIRECGISPNKISFVKIDVEGFEYEALSGMTEILEMMQKGCCIMLEISDRKDKEVKQLLATNHFILQQEIESNYLFIKA